MAVVDELEHCCRLVLDQKNVLLILSNLKTITAFNNSSLETVIGQEGAKWYFPIMNEQSTLPSVINHLKI